MIESSKVHKILYGGDYNPEQWPEEIWKEDMRLFKLAHIDVVTLNVFSWAALQPDEITYDFSKLDKIMDSAFEGANMSSLDLSGCAHLAAIDARAFAKKNAKKFEEAVDELYDVVKRQLVKIKEKEREC